MGSSFLDWMCELYLVSWILLVKDAINPKATQLRSFLTQKPEKRRNHQ